MSDNTSLIIHTKLNRPNIRDDFVPRTALYERLNRNRQRPLTLVTAPAGYGKSTLLSSWLDTLPDKETAWLSLETYDDSPATFFTYCMAAVQTIFPHVGQRTMIVLSQPELPPPRVLLATIISDLEMIESNFVIVLDDYHLIQHPTIQSLMTDLLTHLPATCHLVLASRTDPHLPISRFRALNQVTEIRAHDLRFSQTEASTFIRQNVKKAVDEKLLENIYKRSEGWVTGLHLAALSIRQLEDQEQLNEILQKEDRFIVDYLMSEVLIDQPKVVQEWLLKTSILERFSLELCEAVLDIPPTGADFNGRQFLDQISEQNLFIIPLDQQQIWYRYHHLFSDFLKGRLTQQTSSSEIASLHKKAAIWLEKNNLFEESLNHAFASGDILFAAQVIENNARQLLDTDKYHILANWLERLPKSIIEQSAPLLLAKAWVAFHQFTLWEIPSLMELAEKLLDETDESQRPLLGEVHFFWGHHFYWLGQREQNLQHLKVAVEQVPTKHHLARGQTELFWGVSMQMNGQGDKAIKQLEKWLYYEKTWAYGNPARVLGGLVFIYMIDNNISKAEEHDQQVLQIATELSNPYLIAWAHYILGLTNFSRNDIESAIIHFGEAEKNRYILHHAAVIDNMSTLAFALQVQNQPEEANKIIAELQKFAWDTKNPAYISKAHSSKAHLHLLQGNVPLAKQQFEMVDVSIDEGAIMFYWLENIRLTECRILIAEDTEDSLAIASQKLAAHLQTERNFHNTTKSIEMLSLQAVCYYKQGLTDSALQSLNEAVLLAEPGGSLWQFVDAGPELLTLLPCLPANGATAPFRQKVQGALEGYYGQFLSVPPPRHQQKADQVDMDLTLREREILRLIARGSSNQEIADRLMISIHTVKRHVSNMSKKMGAKNRRQAVAIAESVGLLG